MKTKNNGEQKAIEYFNKNRIRFYPIKFNGSEPSEKMKNHLYSFYSQTWFSKGELKKLDLNYNMFMQGYNLSDLQKVDKAIDKTIKKDQRALSFNKVEKVEEVIDSSDIITSETDRTGIEGEAEKVSFVKHCLEVLRTGDQEAVYERLKARYPELQEDSYGNLYNIKPDTVLLNAHMDNVGKEDNKMCKHITIFKDEKGKYFFANTIKDENGKEKDYNIGADDKIGVAIMTYLYDKMPDKVSVLFTRDEESGCRGSEDFMKKHGNIIEDNIRYCLLADRRYAHDIIGHGNRYCSLEFQKKAVKYLNLFGYKPASGLLSDADKISYAVNCLNLSCGYYNPHSGTEYAMVDEVANCACAIMFMVNNFKDGKISKYPKEKYVTPTENQYGYRDKGKFHPWTDKDRESEDDDMRRIDQIIGGYEAMNERRAEGKVQPPLNDPTEDPFEQTDEFDGYYDIHAENDWILENITTGDEIVVPKGLYKVIEQAHGSEIDEPWDDSMIT